MNPLKSDVATKADCDWSFIANDELMTGLREMVEREARAWSLSVEDTLQEVYLWIAVRPERASEKPWQVVNAARRRVAQLREEARNRRDRETYLEDES